MSVFVDTSALFAALDSDDSNHGAALEAFERLAGVEELITHNYVHVEAEQLIRRRLGSDAAATLIDRLLPALTTIWVDEPVHASAFAEIRSAGRGASLVDHVSFIVMRREGITEALAFDADFDAAGFRRPRLPNQSPRYRLSDQLAPYGSDPPNALEPGLVGVAEIAARSGRSLSTVQSWRRRQVSFPPPLVGLAAGPIWRWADVERWIAKRARPARRPGPLQGRISEPTVPSLRERSA